MTQIVETKETKEIKIEKPQMRFPYSESKKVSIRRKPIANTFRTVNAEAFQDKLWKIGSAFKHNAPLKGLTIEEEIRFLPDLIGVSPKSDKWERESGDYWKNISKNIPEAGLNLEVGMTWKTKEDYEADKNAKHDENGIVKECKGFPINVVDYILYRYCLVYGDCANNEEDIQKSNKIRMFIFSQEVETKRKKSKLQIEIEANQLFYSQLADRSWTNWLLRMLVTNDHDTLNKKLNIGQLAFLSNDDIDISLSDYAKRSPANFLLYGKDRDLELKSFVEECIALGRLIRIANTQSIAFDNQTIGNTLEQTVIFLKDPKNINVLNTLKAQVGIDSK